MWVGSRSPAIMRFFYRFTKAEVDKHNEEDEGDDQEVQQEVEEVQQDEEHQEQEQKSRAKGTWNVQQSKATSKPQQRRESKAREKHTKRRDSKTEAKIKRERGREKEKKEQEEAEVTELGELREPIVKQETYLNRSKKYSTKTEHKTL
jgi:hypothetical protein